MKTDSKILITGSAGMVGKSLVAKLRKRGYDNLLLPRSEGLDLRDQIKTETFFKKKEIDYVFHLAAKVGGIAANIAEPAEFLYDNLMMELNVIESARKHKVKKLIFLGSSCIYPKECRQPMKEEYLLSGKLEPTNEGYALAKICGLKLCEYYNKQYGTNFISLMPCNLYGLNDRFDPKNSHVIPALMLKFHNAKLNNLPFVEVWGGGNARREFLFVEDLADAMIYFMEKFDADKMPSFVNIGYGEDVSIKEIAGIIKEVTGYKGDIKFDKSKPEGMLRKLLDVNKAKRFGWTSKTGLKQGLILTYNWFKNHSKD